MGLHIELKPKSSIKKKRGGGTNEQRYVEYGAVNPNDTS